jgi:sec1 family domain-containing protein 1
MAASQNVRVVCCVHPIIVKLTGVWYTQIPSTLQEAQTAAILSLIKLNHSPDLGGNSSSLSESELPVWKILVLDRRTKDVLATVLRVQDLRDVGVTLHVQVL